jgi:hypothetical protein
MQTLHHTTKASVILKQSNNLQSNRQISSCRQGEPIKRVLQFSTEEWGLIYSSPNRIVMFIGFVIAWSIIDGILHFFFPFSPTTSNWTAWTIYWYLFTSWWGLFLACIWKYGDILQNTLNENAFDRYLQWDPSENTLIELKALDLERVPPSQYKDGILHTRTLIFHRVSHRPTMIVFFICIWFTVDRYIDALISYGTTLSHIFHFAWTIFFIAGAIISYRTNSGIVSQYIDDNKKNFTIKSSFDPWNDQIHLLKPKINKID